MGDVIARDHKILALLVLAAHHDVAVGVPRIEMINRNPVQPRTEVGLHLPHQVAHEWLELGQLITVFGSYDETELMAIALGLFQEHLAIDADLLGPVQVAGRAFAGHAVALDVT